MIVLTLKTCDTCRRALEWLAAEGIAHENRDVRADGIDRQTVERIVDAAGPDRAVNKRSATWRNLASKRELSRDHAVDLIMGEATIMKRPVFLLDDDVLVGFNDAVKARLLG